MSHLWLTALYLHQKLAFFVSTYWFIRPWLWKEYSFLSLETHKPEPSWLQISIFHLMNGYLGSEELRMVGLVACPFKIQLNNTPLTPWFSKIWVHDNQLQSASIWQPTLPSFEPAISPPMLQLHLLY